ncbi:PREDICTED: glutamine synthetase cytosolic isozyme 1-like [Populus euphratica]|uniref:Glutamate--ammonia ligase n=1 Tax=Populus euphratica TaxID=75702 RepID=A0AAJ6U1B7_POPEU|nr:PREDICTED: glutamine synthetase cytosolic isozyme 1-like [Populus euphratica]
MRCNSAKLFSHPDVVAERGYGVEKAFGPDIVDAHYKACLLAGINFSDINGEVMPGQVGLLVCISSGDELWAAGHILERIIDVAGVVLPFDHKPFQLIYLSYSTRKILHIFSTKSMRNKGGYEVIKKAIEKPGLRHIGQIAASVEGNGQRVAADTKHLTLILSNGVLLIVGLPFMFNNE